MNTEKTLAFGEGIARRRVPMLEIKIAKLRIGCLIAPRIQPSLSAGRAIGGALPLGLGGKRLPCPACIGGCLGLTDVGGPVEYLGQRQFLKHRSPNPVA